MCKNGAERLSPGLMLKASRLPEQPSGLSVQRVLREEGCNVLEKIDDSEYGKFAWVIDPEGNKIELWQPPAGQ